MASIPSLLFTSSPGAGLPLKTTLVLPKERHTKPVFLSPKLTSKSSNLSLFLTSFLFCGQKGGLVRNYGREFADCKPGCLTESTHVWAPGLSAQATLHPSGLVHRALLWAGGCH